MTCPHCARTIAIDGPSASGKSAVGRRAADRLGHLFLDTGTMYRAITWLALQQGVHPADADALERLAQDCDMQVAPGSGAEYATILCRGIDVSRHLREVEVTANVSAVSKVAGVRSAMVELQRRLAADRPIVMVGRDIGTVVLPNAELKVYIDAPVEVRGERRWRELRAGDPSLSLDWVIEDLRRRDAIDSNRELSPLRPAEDAVILDTGPLSLDEVVQRILALACCPTGVRSA